MDKDSQLIFEGYLDKRKQLPSNKRKNSDTSSGKTASISIPGDQQQRNLPQDPSVNYTYSDAEPDDDVIDVASEPVEDTPTRENPNPPKQITNKIPQKPAYQNTQEPESQSFKDYYNEPTSKGVKFADRASSNKIRKRSRNLVKGIGKAANILRKGLLRTIDPFNNKGLLGTAANAASDIENWMRTGSDPLASLKPRFDGLKNIKDKILNPNTSSEEHAKNIAKFRDKYIYSRDSDTQLIKDFEDNFNVKFPIKSNEVKRLFGTDIKKRNKGIKNPGHLANIVLDIYNTKVGRGVTPQKAMEESKGEINNPAIAKYLVSNGLLPF